jgi:hypothetical protein
LQVPRYDHARPLVADVRRELNAEHSKRCRRRG